MAALKKQAGKTILFGALEMLLGKRSNFESVRNKSKKCIIEGSFTFTDKKIKKIKFNVLFLLTAGTKAVFH